MVTAWHYHKQFVNYFVPALQVAFSHCLKQRPPITTAQADQLKTFYTHILACYMVPELVQRSVTVDFSTPVFEHWEEENLERKVQALKQLTTDISLTIDAEEPRKQKILIAYIDSLNIFSLLYTRENHHSQLCSRS